jgi:hypothetical protein
LKALSGLFNGGTAVSHRRVAQASESVAFEPARLRVVLVLSPGDRAISIFHFGRKGNAMAMQVAKLPVSTLDDDEAIDLAGRLAKDARGGTAGGR